VGTDSAQELVEGVENMQVLYGVRLANNNLAYLPADSVINWTQVVSLRIGLLLRTLDDNLTTTADNQSYNANGADVLGTMVKPVSDRRLRRVISTTISIRNTAI
jgi:type IV pilus assembly protein PilW